MTFLPSLMLFFLFCWLWLPVVLLAPVAIVLLAAMKQYQIMD